MRGFVKLFGGAFALLFPSVAYAGCAVVLCSDVPVNRLYVHATGPTLVLVPGDLTSLHCAPIGGVYLSLDMSAPQAQAVYALLLSAHMQKSKVAIRLDDGGGDCRIMYVTSDQ